MGIKGSAIYKKARSIYHRLRYILREKYNSLFLPYYRDVFIKEILSTPPFPADTGSTLELHHLTCKRDLLNSLWALKTFLYYSGLRPGLFIHNDGSLDMHDKKILLSHFTGANFIDKKEADALVREKLARHQYCARVRFEDFLPYSIKIFDYFYFSKSKSIINLDSDILFFQQPEKAMELIKENAGFYAKDSSYAYTFKLEESRILFNVDVPPYINVGFFYIASDKYFDLDFMEHFFKKAYEKRTSSMWWEQTVYALCFVKSGLPFEFLGPEYQIFRQKITSSTVMHHFTRPVRKDLYSVGLRKLHTAGFLKKLSQKNCHGK